MRLKPLVDSFSLSPMQMGMLFHFLKEPHSGVDIQQIVIHLPEVVDAKRLEAAWRWLVYRHDVLRARFIWEETDPPRQEILSDVDVPFSVEDIRVIPSSEQDSRVQMFLAEDRVHGIDLGCAPMMRLRLFERAESFNTLVWTFHHAILDGRCYPILLREVFEAYEELGQGGHPTRPTPYSYRRFIDWLEQRDLSSSETFWKGQLDGFSAATPLVLDRSSSGDLTIHRLGEAWNGLDAVTTTTLRRLADREGLTLNAFLMAAWAILLHRYSGQTDIVFGATRACRKSSIEHAHETIGLFINTVPVRVRLRGEDPGIEIVRLLRQQWFDIRPHEHTPLATVKAVSHVPPGGGLFDSLVVFEHRGLDEAMRLLGGKWTNRRLELHELTNFPITLAAYDGDALRFKIEFDRRRFDEKTIGRMLGHLRQLLEGMGDDPHVAVRDLSILGEEERADLVGGFNPPVESPSYQLLPLDGEATLHGLFEAQVARRPHAVAVTGEGNSLTYAELNVRANCLAWELRRRGVTPNTLVGVCLDRSSDLILAVLAILKAGGAYLPIDLSYPADRLAFMLEDAQAPVLVTQRKLGNQIPPMPGKVLYLEDVPSRPVESQEELNPPHVADADHLAYVIYTSGTTGKPKGSLIGHRNVVRLFSNTERWYRFDEHDVWTLFHSIAFDFSVWEIWGALLYGGRVVVVPFLVSRSPESFYALLVREGVTVLNQTPSAFRQLIQAEESIGPKPLALRYVIFGGEKLEVKSLRPWFERHGDQQPQLVNMYGITETTVHVTYRPLSKDDLDSGSVIGMPIPDLQVYILDERRQPVPIGVPGELYVGGAGVAKGYLCRPELTAERFIPDHLTGREGSRLYRTGDLARFLPSRDIEYLGRIDHQVKIRGFRIELGEIESVLCQHPDIREAVVIAREDVPGVKTLAAYIVSSSPAPEVTVLREHLKKTLPDYMVPAAFVFLEKLPLTASGKIDRRALPAPEQHRPQCLSNYVAPRTSYEERLAAIWSKVLRVERVGVHDNFFELGGDSILSIQVIAAARRDRLMLTAKQMFTCQTIAELAAAVEVEGDVRPAQDVVEGDVPLTPIQRWFFEQNLEEGHHYNQALMLEVGEQLDRDRLERALKVLEHQHDGLRLRYVYEHSEWRQYYSVAGEDAPLDWVNISGLDEKARSQIIESRVASAHQSLHLERGPLWRIVYFDRGPNVSGLLLIVIHHLVVDGVSWQPLVEDLETVYGQFTAGSQVQLPSKTVSFKAWAEELQEFSASNALEEDLAYWRAVATSAVSSGMERHAAAVDNREGSAKTITVSLDRDNTEALLHTVPAVYNTQINDVLLTALARAWDLENGSGTLCLNLEGHGREPLSKELDLSRTVGWFTSIFPVRLALPISTVLWDPGQALKSIKEQLRKVPRRGIGYGLLRYLGDHSELAFMPEPMLVFNYLGQFDQVVSHSKLFRFSSQSTGAWHGLKQQRRHALEINSLVKDGCLESSWTYCPAIHATESIQRLASGFVSAMKQLIEHCRQPSVGGWTPSDFPLAQLDQLSVDRLVTGRKDVEDLYRLSPIQSLFYSVNPGAQLSEFDQWQCTLHGVLNLVAFQRAWHETIHRHTVLRSTIHGEGLNEPIQLVHRRVGLPWTVQDWRHVSEQERAIRWLTFLQEDRGRPLMLTEAPIMRLALFQTADDIWRFVWTVPALLLDGWSWPIVFREVSRLYASFVQDQQLLLDPVRPYRDYIAWIRQHSTREAQAFWRNDLKGLRLPTALPSEAPNLSAGGDRYPEHAVVLSAALTADLQGLARRLHVTLGTLVQAAWALVLMRQSGTSDVVFGTAFSGRPAELRGGEHIVGPFVNNLPIRVRVGAHTELEEFLRKLHAHILEVSQYQFLPLLDIQDCSELPWQYRLFDSLVVFQNYLVDDTARCFGGAIRIEDFTGPVHTNYSVLLLAEPGSELRFVLIYDRQDVAHSAVERWGKDLRSLMEQMPLSLECSLQSLLQQLSSPVGGGFRRRKALQVESQQCVPPQSTFEKEIAAVWQRMFGLEQVSVEDNLFDLGGHSLLLVRMHARLRAVLKREFPLVTLLTYPSIRALARHFEQSGELAQKNSDERRERARLQKDAIAQFKRKLGTK